VVFGKSSGFASAISLSSLNGVNGFRLDGIDGGDESGHSVSNAGDVNGDGFDDLIIGAWKAGSFSGESYVVLGGNFTSEVETQVGNASANTLTANQGPSAIDILIGGLGNDTLVSDGGADVLRGAEGDDTMAIPDASFSSTRRLMGGNGTEPAMTLSLPGMVMTSSTVASAPMISMAVAGTIH